MSRSASPSLSWRRAIATRRSSRRSSRRSTSIPTRGDGERGALLATAADAAQAHGARHLTAWLLRDNAPALAFYERTGFRRDGAVRDQEIGPEGQRIAVPVIRLVRPLPLITKRP